MKRNCSLLFGLTLFAAVFVSAFLVAGCGDNRVPPVAPGEGGNALGFFESTVDGPLAQSGNWTLSSDADTIYVGKAGGTITLNLGGQRSTFKIPADAVCSSGGSCVVKITAMATEIMTAQGRLFLYDFGPDGQKFAKPCELKLFAGFTPGQIVRLYWLDPVANAWVLLQQGKVGAHGEVQFTITHFSKYGIS